MRRKLFLLFNHTLTEAQKHDAEISLHIDQYVYMPGKLRAFWENIPPEGNIDAEILDAVNSWLLENASADDYILVQGDFGAVFYVVDFCLQHGLVPVYSTTSRNYEEKRLPDAYIESRHVFRHVQYRKYIRCDHHLYEYQQQLKDKENKDNREK